METKNQYFEVASSDQLELNLEPSYQTALRNLYTTLMERLGYTDGYNYYNFKSSGFRFIGLPFCFPTNSSFLPIQIQCWVDDGHDDGKLIPSYPYRGEETVNILGCAMNRNRFIELTALWKLPAKKEVNESGYIHYLKSKIMSFNPVNWALGDSIILQERPMWEFIGSYQEKPNPLKAAEDILQAIETVKLWKPN